MNKEEILGNYPILRSKLFNNTLISIINILDRDKDGLEEDRCDMINFFNKWSKDDNDKFFYNFLNHVIFINEGVTAYTDNLNRLVCLNYPCTEIIPQDNKRMPRWYFVYCHECLHQLWDTFDVGKLIEQADGFCDYLLLNIASDCVINDFLIAIHPSHKIPPINGVTPESIKSNYGVEYDRKVDTLYGLYEKLIKLDKKSQNLLKKDYPDEDFGGKKIKPASVTIKKQDDDDDNTRQPPQPPRQPVDEEYRKGWIQAIKDVLDGKVDPRKYFNNKPLPRIKFNQTGDSSSTSNSKLYNAGYEDAIKQILDGLENGLTLNQSNNSSSSNGGGLPQIPWDIKNNSSSNGQKNGNDDKSSDDKNSNGSNASNNESSNTHIGRAQNSNNSAIDSIKNGDNKKATQQIENAIKELEQAADDKSISKESRENIKNAINDAKDALNLGDNKKATDKIKDAIDKELGNNNTGDSKNSNNSNDSNGDKTRNNNVDTSPGSNDKSNLFDELYSLLDLVESKRHGDEVIEKAKNSITGKIKPFIEKCGLSKKCTPTLLINTESNKGNVNWPKELELQCLAYVRNKLRTRKEYTPTYNRVRRGERAFTSADLASGRRAIMQGRQEALKKIGFDISLYIDISGSMSGCIDTVFETIYEITDRLVDELGKERTVDKDKISVKTYVFDTQMKQIKYHTKHKTTGSTYEFDKLLEDVYANGSASFLNIIITDGGFSTVRNAEIAKTIKKMEGLFIMVTVDSNKAKFDDTMRIVKNECGTPKLSVIYTDNNFTIKE